MMQPGQQAKAGAAGRAWPSKSAIWWNCQLCVAATIVWPLVGEFEGRYFGCVPGKCSTYGLYSAAV